jgi:ABC-type branched-subunit amino acid transport system substrate-binding protein
MPAPKPRWLIPALALLLLVGCYPVVPRVVRIGLVAPFEGRYREIGTALIPAVRLAVREWAADHLDAAVAIELVAYDDGADPEMAAAQARDLAIDPDVLVVIGHWREDTTQAALPIYREAGLPLIVYSLADVPGERTVNLSPSLADLESLASTVDARPMFGLPDDITAAAEALEREALDGPIVGGPLWGLNQFYALAGAAAEGAYFVTGAALPSDLGVEDDSVFTHPLASLGYDAALVALSAIQSADAPTREAVAAALLDEQVEGMTGPISFDSGRRADAPTYLYVWQDGQPHLIGGRDE